MKSHMTNIDILYMIHELTKNIIDNRVDNIYEINHKQYVIKFVDKDKNKTFIKINSGHYFYAIKEKPDNCINIPNSFCMKLRKHINNKKCLYLKQIGSDRIIIISFGFDTILYHIIIEFYADGNIILCDENYKIIANVRNYKNNEIDIKVGNIYPVQYFDNTSQLKKINKSILYQYYETHRNIMNNMYHTFKDCELIIKLGLTIIKHCSIQSNNNFDLFYQYIEDFINMFCYDTIQLSENDNNNNDDNNENYSYYIYDENNKLIDVCPILYSFYKNNKHIKINSLSKAYHQHFQELNTDKKQKTIKKKKDKNRIDNIDKSNQSRIRHLDNKIDNIDKVIEWIYENLKPLENLLRFIKNNSKCNTIDYLQSNYMIYHFHDIQIKKIDYNLNHIILFDKFIKLEITLNYVLSIHNNINDLYDIKKKLTYKKDKTIIENQKIIDKIKKEMIKNTNQLNNKDNTIEYQFKTSSYWFQQFHWTITSNKLLLIIGNTAEQNELIVKKYLDDNTHYFHADFNGSPSGILFYPDKNNKNNDDYIKDRLDANEFLLSHTKLWKDKIYDKCFYVDNSQLSKTPPSGEYINQGSFMIYGKKNYLSNSQYEMGIGLLFVLNNIENKNNDNNLINNFTENPNKNSDIVYCIPILGSYKSLSSYKYKIKLIPGKQKKNKIIKTIISHFIKLSNQNDKETFLIKKIDKNLLDKCILSHSQLVLSKK